MSVRFSDLEAALRQHFPATPPVTYRPDSDIMQGFAAFGDVQAMQASHLGYPADRDLDELITRAISEGRVAQTPTPAARTGTVARLGTGSPR